MVNKREEEGREKREERKGKEGKATQPSCDERNPWGDRRGKLVTAEGEKNGAAKNGSKLRYY